MLPVQPSSLIQTSLGIQYQVVSYGYFRTGHLTHFPQGCPSCLPSKQTDKMATVGGAWSGSAAQTWRLKPCPATPSPLVLPGCAPLKGREDMLSRTRRSPTLGCSQDELTSTCTVTPPPTTHTHSRGGWARRAVNESLDLLGNIPGLHRREDTRPLWCENEWEWKEEGSPGQAPPPGRSYPAIRCPRGSLLIKRKI